MKNIILSVSVLTLVIFVGILSCTKKKSEGIKPGYGTTGNPNPNNPTVTGSTTYTNPATDNSSIGVGGSGWSNPTCGSTSSITLKGYNAGTEVTLSFLGAAKSQTYAIGTTVSSGICALTIVNAPSQPNGIVWYGKSGTVVVNTTSNSINATFANIVCTQSNFNFPTVTASGVLGCSQ